MPANKRHTEPRLIVPETPDLPESFIFIDGYDSYEVACQVWEAFENPAVSLAVWGYAPESTPDALKESVRALSALRDFRPQQISTQTVRRFWNIVFDDEDYFCQKPMADHFARVAALTNSRDDLLTQWQENCMEITDDFIDAFCARSVTLQTQFRRNGDDRSGVQNNDDLHSHSIRAMRVLVGDAPHFYESEDGQPWTVRPWDFVFVRHNTLQQSPSPLCGYNAENRHVAEIYDIKSRHEFVSDAPRAWFKKWRRLPQPD